MFALNPLQDEAAGATGTSLLFGPVGVGKTTALQERLLRLLKKGEPAYTILVLVAEPEHRQSFETSVIDSGLGPFADLKLVTYNQMALEMVTLFWPLVARQSGFEYPYQPPTLLTYDLAQLLMWQVVIPRLEAGAFAALRLRPQQIVSQILDTLNRAAFNGLTLEQAAERQKSTWSGEKSRLLHLEQAAEAAGEFRKLCLQNSLLDLSLSVHVFDKQLVHNPQFHRYFTERYRHVIVDNIEEQTSAGQNFVVSLMDLVETMAIAYDENGGYKRFLSADPAGARQFRSRCESIFDFEESYISSPKLWRLANLVESYLMHTTKPTAGAEGSIIAVASGRYRREMVNNLARLLSELVANGVSPKEIAIVAPYLDGALSYSLTQELAKENIPYRILRRRSSPREEPRVRAWLTWLLLAHPEWDRFPSSYDVAEAMSVSIQYLDPARAELLAKNLYDPKTGEMLPATQLPEKIRDRVDADTVDRVEELRLWLASTERERPIDIFLHRLFMELLSQSRFQPDLDLSSAAVCEWLVKTATGVREAAAGMGLRSAQEIALTFVDGINQGLVSANPPDLGKPPDPDGVLLSTVYGFLLEGHPVHVQVWLETAATGWWDIPNQPLSNAFVFTQSYEQQTPWTMTEDFRIRNELLSGIIRGLCGRCRDGIILANSDLDRRGLYQDGPLWRALQPVLRQSLLS